MTKRRFWTGVVAVLATGAVMAPGLASAQASLSADATRILQREGPTESWFGVRSGIGSALVEIGSGSRSDRAAMLAGCENIHMTWQFQPLASRGGSNYDLAVLTSAQILASAVDALAQARAGPEGKKRLDDNFDFDRNQGAGTYGNYYLRKNVGPDETFACFLRVARGLVSAGSRASVVRPTAPASQGTARASANPGQTRSLPSAPPQTIPSMSDLLKMPTDDVLKLADDVLKLADNLGNWAPAPPPPPSYSGYNSAETQALIDQLLKPQGPSAAAGMSSRPMVDLAALAAGGPASESSKRDDAAARQAYEAGKSRRMHNSLNDATACLRVEPTGARTEWGIEGRFRLINSCDYPVSASWCANTRECELKRGNLWTIRPRGGYPIYFADLANPQIQVGGCREGEGKRPLPSDADLSRQGGVSEARSQPIPAVGVSLLPSHRCD